MFRSEIHFELIFTYIFFCKTRVQLHFFHVDIQLSQDHLLKRLFFPLNYPSTIVKNQLTLSVRIYFWVLNSIPLIYVSIVMPLPYYLGNCSFVVNLKLGNILTKFVLHFQDYLSFFFFFLSSFGSFALPYQLQHQPANFCKDSSWNFARDCVDFVG